MSESKGGATIFRVREAFGVPGPGGFIHMYRQGDLVDGASKLAKTHRALLEPAENATVDVVKASEAVLTLPERQTVEQVTAPGSSHAVENPDVRDAGRRNAATETEEPGKGEESTGDGPFDPSAHTVEEVNAYLDGEGVTAEERERVLAAEREGKNRTTIVG